MINELAAETKLLSHRVLVSLRSLPDRKVSDIFQVPHSSLNRQGLPDRLNLTTVPP